MSVLVAAVSCCHRSRLCLFFYLYRFVSVTLIVGSRPSSTTVGTRFLRSCLSIALSNYVPTDRFGWDSVLSILSIVGC